MINNARDTFTVFGCAYVDMVSKADIQEVPNLTKPGKIDMDVGGTGFNVAINLAKQGLKTKFVSYMNNSPFSQIVARVAQENMVNTVISTNDDNKTIARSVHFDQHGKITSDIAVSYFEDIMFSDEFIEEQMESAEVVIFDTSLNSASINSIVSKANAYMIPVIGVVSSEITAYKLLEIEGQVDIVFVGKNDVSYLVRKYGLRAETYLDLHNMLKLNLVVNREDAGAAILRNGIEESIKALPYDYSKGNKLGVLEAMAAGAIYYHIKLEKPLNKAVKESMLLAVAVRRKDTSNMGVKFKIEQFFGEMSQRAYYDKLTKLLNRWAMEEEINREVSKFFRGVIDNLCVLLIDIDHFKKVNDNYGHNAGDVVLTTISGIIKKTIRKHDVVARWGGEEFICMMSGVSLQEAKVLGDRIRLAILKEYPEMDLKWQPLPKQVTVSVGVAQMKNGEDIKKWIERADEQLYQAKRKGRNRVEPSHNPNTDKLNPMDIQIKEK